MSLLTSLVQRCRGPNRIYECRRCGTTLAAGSEDCPACDEASVAVYEL